MLFKTWTFVEILYSSIVLRLPTYSATFSIVRLFTVLKLKGIVRTGKKKNYSEKVDRIEKPSAKVYYPIAIIFLFFAIGLSIEPPTIVV